MKLTCRRCKKKKKMKYGRSVVVCRVISLISCLCVLYVCFLFSIFAPSVPPFTHFLMSDGDGGCAARFAQLRRRLSTACRESDTNGGTPERHVQTVRGCCVRRGVLRTEMMHTSTRDVQNKMCVVQSSVSPFYAPMATWSNTAAEYARCETARQHSSKRSCRSRNALVLREERTQQKQTSAYLTTVITRALLRRALQADSRNHNRDSRPTQSSFPSFSIFWGCNRLRRGFMMVYPPPSTADYFL